MKSAFGVEHPDMVSKAKVPIKIGGIRMGTPKGAYNAGMKNYSHARKGGAGVMSSVGTGLKSAFRAAPGTTTATAGGALGVTGLATGYALKSRD